MDKLTDAQILADALCKQSRERQAEVRKRIQAIYNDAPPYTEEQLRNAGRDWREKLLIDAQQTSVSVTVMTIHRILGVMVIGAGVCALVFKEPTVFLAVGVILAGINQVIRA